MTTPSQLDYDRASFFPIFSWRERLAEAFQHCREVERASCQEEIDRWTRRVKVMEQRIQTAMVVLEGK